MADEPHEDVDAIIARARLVAPPPAAGGDPLNVGVYLKTVEAVRQATLKGNRRAAQDKLQGSVRRSASAVGAWSAASTPEKNHDLPQVTVQYRPPILPSVVDRMLKERGGEAGGAAGGRGGSGFADPADGSAFRGELMLAALESQVKRATAARRRRAPVAPASSTGPALVPVLVPRPDVKLSTRRPVELDMAIPSDRVGDISGAGRRTRRGSAGGGIAIPAGWLSDVAGAGKAVSASAAPSVPSSAPASPASEGAPSHRAEAAAAGVGAATTTTTVVESSSGGGAAAGAPPIHVHITMPAEARKAPSPAPPKAAPTASQIAADASRRPIAVPVYVSKAHASATSKGKKGSTGSKAPAGPVVVPIMVSPTPPAHKKTKVVVVQHVAAPAPPPPAPVPAPALPQGPSDADLAAASVTRLADTVSGMWKDVVHVLEGALTSKAEPAPSPAATTPAPAPPAVSDALLLELLAASAVKTEIETGTATSRSLRSVVDGVQGQLAALAAALDGVQAAVAAEAQASAANKAAAEAAAAAATTTALAAVAASEERLAAAIAGLSGRLEAGVRAAGADAREGVTLLAETVVEQADRATAAVDAAAAAAANGARAAFAAEVLPSLALLADEVAAARREAAAAAAAGPASVIAAVNSAAASTSAGLQAHVDGKVDGITAALEAAAGTAAVHSKLLAALEEQVAALAADLAGQMALAGAGGDRDSAGDVTSAADTTTSTAEEEDEVPYALPEALTKRPAVLSYYATTPLATSMAGQAAPARSRAVVAAAPGLTRKPLSPAGINAGAVKGAVGSKAGEGTPSSPLAAAPLAGSTLRGAATRGSDPSTSLTPDIRARLAFASHATLADLDLDTSGDLSVGEIVLAEDYSVGEIVELLPVTNERGTATGLLPRA